VVEPAPRRAAYHRAVPPDRPIAALSLLDAARVLARGGNLDAKLEAIADHARAIGGCTAAAVLLYDPETDRVVSLDGTADISASGADAALAQAIRDRRPVTTRSTSVDSDLVALVPAPRHTFVPLVIEEDAGPEVEGLLVLGTDATAPDAEALEAAGALADLAAVAIRQVRLRNALDEHSAYEARLAHTDALTGLANRTTFEQMLELELARAGRTGIPVSVCLFSVDDLDRRSATDGGMSVDDALRSVAATLAAEVRLVDTVARLGGGEFGVVAPGEGGVILGDRVRIAVAGLARSSGAALSVSVGTARSPENGTISTELLSSAEDALSRARQGGPGALAAAPVERPSA
jgi:diguanylate cyclase (GGDEF)-like protein